MPGSPDHDAGPAGQRTARRLEDRPPFFRTWGAVYAVVLGWLALLVVLFRLLTDWAA